MKQTDQYLSIAELNRLLNVTLEQSVGTVHFEGEISEITKAMSGHVYAALKDENAQIQIVLWASSVKTLGFNPEKGMTVRCTGRPALYPKTGRLQIIVQRMVPAGEGALQKKFLELKAKLEKEGLFAAERKRALPFIPKAIGVVTSAAGAAIHDIMVKLKERMPQIPVYLVDVRVQGQGAAEEIAAAIQYLSRSNLVEVIIAGRGGGSLEDLWAFNEEVVVRAIFASRIPVISAVGHEVDISLSDLVADIRAPTPTAAAELVVPKREELLRAIAEHERRLLEYERWFSVLVQRVDELSLALARRTETLLEAQRLKLSASEARLKAIEPKRLLSQLLERLAHFDYKLKSATERTLQQLNHRLERFTAQMDGVNPKRILERGYSVVQHKEKLIRSSADVEIQTEIDIILWQGKLAAKVLSKE